MRFNDLFSNYSALSLYLTLTSDMLTFHSVAIPNVLYLLLHYLSYGKYLFLVSCTQTQIMKIIDSNLFSQICLGPFSLELMQREGKRVLQLFLLEDVQVFVSDYYQTGTE